MENKDYTIAPIGYVRLSQGPPRLEIDPGFRPALGGLDGFSHLVVLFWCHLADDAGNRATRVVEKPYLKGPERLGLFATRSPVRPNPIGLTPVRILSLDPESGVIAIPFIDAEDKTPILDLKPYTPALDRVREAETPDWCGHWPRWLEDSAEFDWEAEFNY